MSGLSVRKCVMPLMAAGMLAVANTACNNAEKQKLNDAREAIEFTETLNDAREAIEFTKTFGEEGAELCAKYNTYDVDALDVINEETDKETEQAYLEFVANGEDNTKWDSVFMSDLIADRKDTKAAIDFLKAKAAMNQEEYHEQEELLKSCIDGCQQKPSLTQQQQDSVVKANINEYNYELLQNQLRKLSINCIENMSSLNELSDLIKQLSQMIDTTNVE